MSMQEYWDDRARSGEDPWAPVYDGRIDLSNYNFITRRAGTLNLMKGDPEYPLILDVGCGTGDYSALAPQHKGTYHGVDFSFGMIAAARKTNEGHGAERFIVGSGDALPYRSDTFDLVAAMGFIEYFNEPDGPMGEMRRVLKPGGTLVIQSFKKELVGRLTSAVTEPFAGGGGSPGPGDSRIDKPDTWVDRKYDMAEFDELMSRNGFERTGFCYNHFFVLPGPLRRKFPSLHVKLSELVGRVAPTVFGSLAVNYIAKYRLRPDAK